MDTISIIQNGYCIFMNSGNKTYDVYRLLLNLLDKVDIKGRDRYGSLSILSIY